MIRNTTKFTATVALVLATAGCAQMQAQVREVQAYGVTGRPASGQTQIDDEKVVSSDHGCKKRRRPFLVVERNEVLPELDLDELATFLDHPSQSAAVRAYRAVLRAR